MLRKFNEDDFAVLRGPLESRRQSPSSLGAGLILSIVLQVLFLFLEYFVAGDYSNIYPHKDKILAIHVLITLTIVGFCAIYSITRVYMRRQNVQYFLGIVVTQNLGVSMYIIALFFIGKGAEITKESLLTFTYVTLLFGLLIFIATCIRFYILLRKGHYRRGSEKDKLRSKFETKSYLPMVTIGSIGVLFIIQFLVSTFSLEDFELMLVIVLGILIFFTLIFVLPEQLVILYCKFRFDSFNYSKKGKLKPFNNQRKGARK